MLSILLNCFTSFQTVSLDSSFKNEAKIVKHIENLQKAIGQLFRSNEAIRTRFMSTVQS